MKYKYIIVTPAGRKKYLQILYKHLQKQYQHFDEWILWINTNNTEDVDFCKNLEKTNSWIKTIECPVPTDGIMSIYSFFTHACDPECVYLRLDDDIIWLESNFINKLFDFRINNPNYFLVYGNIINNAVIDHLHQRFGCIDYKQIISYYYSDNNGRKNPYISYEKHNKLLEALEAKTLNQYKFNRWILFSYEKVSINAISWFGSEFAKFNGIVGRNEEHWLSVDKPKELQKPNCIYGEVLCSHFAFYPQRSYLDNTDLLEKYNKLI